MTTLILCSHVLGRKPEDAVNVHISAILSRAGGVRGEFLEELFFERDLKDQCELIKQKRRRKAFQSQGKFS